MKKLLALSVLFTMLAAAAFAQFTVGLDADFYPELLRVTAPTGDNADREEDEYNGTGTFGFLTEWGNWWSNSLRLTLKYADPDGNYSGHIRFRGDSFIQPSGYTSGVQQDENGKFKQVGFFRGGGDNAGGSVSAIELFSRHIDDYSLTGKLGAFSAYFGNGNNRGKVDAFQQGFSNFLLYSKIDNYGLLKPTVDEDKGELSLGDYDVNNLRKSAPNTSVTYLSGTVDLNPFYISLASSVFQVSPSIGSNASWSRGNAAIRVSGVNIADLLTFDVLYKVSGADPNTDKNKPEPPKQGAGPQPDGKGQWDNDLGIYANIKIPGVDGLGLGLGYSGYFHVSEDRKAGDDTVKISNPLFSGIDLRVKFTGIDKLTVTLNNQISFAGAKGEDSETKENNGVAGKGLGDKEKDSFFGLYNGLLVAYKFTDTFTGRAEVANRLGSYTYTNDSKETKYGYDFLQFELGGAFGLTSHVGFEAGLALQIANNTLKRPDVDEKSKGTFTFGIPLRMHIVF
jgi:hypothetical protein